MYCDITSKSTQQYLRIGSSDILPPNLWDFFPARSHEFGSCLVTNSSAMEALGSPSISWALMGGGYAFQIPKTSVSRQPVQRHYGSLTGNPFYCFRISLKIFNRLCIFLSVFLFGFVFLASLHVMKSRKNNMNITTTCKPFEQTHLFCRFFFFFFFF